MTMRDPTDTEIKRFNPVFDMMAEEVFQQKLNPSEVKPKNSVYDIEDLTKFGKEKSLCPYYLAKSRLAASDIVVVPYQYILDPELRKQNQFNLKGSIIVFDEAHNIDKQCEDI
jgi:Rad3-related DNA helicase